LMATTSMPSILYIWRYTSLPIRPKPLIATFTVLIFVKKF